MKHVVLVGVVVALVAGIATHVQAATKDEVVRVKVSELSSVVEKAGEPMRERLEPSPAGEVYVDGKWAGRSPVSVPIQRRRHEIERVTREPGKNLALALLSVTVCTAIFPPAGFAVLSQASKGGHLTQTKRETVYRHEAMTYQIEVRRTDHLPARAEVSSDRFTRVWSPTLQLTAAAKAKRERERRAAEIARRKILEERQRKEEAERLARTAAAVAREMGEAASTLGEIVDESNKTRRSLLKKEW